MIELCHLADFFYLFFPVKIFMIDSKSLLISLVDCFSFYIYAFVQLILIVIGQFYLTEVLFNLITFQGIYISSFSQSQIMNKMSSSCMTSLAESMMPSFLYDLQ